MKPVALLVLGAALAAQAWGGELRIARCDIERVFNEYQHTVELQGVINTRRNQTGPQTTRDSGNRGFPKLTRSPADVERLEQEWKQARRDSPERDNLQRRWEVARWELEMQTFELQQWQRSREQELQKEAMRWREEILGEVLAEVRAFALERGYDLVVTDSFPRDGNPPPLIVTRRSDEVTEELLVRLNKRYASRKDK